MKQHLKKIIKKSQNRLYKDSLLDREVSEMYDLLLKTAKEIEKEPESLLVMVELHMSEMTNYAFCQSLVEICEKYKKKMISSDIIKEKAIEKPKPILKKVIIPKLTQKGFF